MPSQALSYRAQREIRSSSENQLLGGAGIHGCIPHLELKAGPPKEGPQSASVN